MTNVNMTKMMVLFSCLKVNDSRVASHDVHRDDKALVDTVVFDLDAVNLLH